MSSSPKKLLAVDLDGTLLGLLGAPHERDLAALRAAAAEGIAITIITGRLFSGTRAAAIAAGIRGPVACVDGSHVVRVAGEETLVHHGIRGIGASRVQQAVRDARPATFVFAADRIVHDDDGVPYLGYLTTWSSEVESTDAVHNHHVWDHPHGLTAVVCVGTSEQIDGVARVVRDELGESVQTTTFPIRRIGAWGLVARASGGNKGTALKWLANHHGVAIEHAVCVGDWINDVPMFLAAGRSFVMGQAPPEVKAKASDVLFETVDTGGGVAAAIERAFGIKARV